MEVRVSPVESIVFTQEGFDQWESECRWPTITRAERSLLFAHLYFVIGALLVALGQYRHSFLIFRRGLAFTGPDSPELARRVRNPMRLQLATALIEYGDFQAASEELNGLQASFGPRQEPGFYVRRLELLGKLNMLRGRFGAALDCYYEVNRCCQSYNFTRAQIIAALNLAHALIFLNHTAAASELLASVEMAAHQIGEPALLSRTQLLRSLARARGHSTGSDVPVVPSVTAIRFQQSDTSRDNESFQEISEIAQVGNYLQFFEDRSLHFYWRLNTGRAGEAADALRQMTAVFVKSDSRIIKSKLLMFGGIIEYYRGDLCRAEQTLLQSRDQLRSLDLQPDLWQAQRVLGWCLARLGRPNARREMSQQNQLLIEELADSMPQSYQSLFLLNKWTDDEEFLAGQVDQLVTMKQKIQGSPWYLKPLLRWQLSKGIIGLIGRLNSHKRTITNTAMKVSAVDSDGAPSLWKHFWSYPRDRATILFLVLPDRVCVIRAVRFSFDIGVSYVTRIEIREKVQRWHLLAQAALAASSKPAPDLDDLNNLTEPSLRNLLPISERIPAQQAEDAEKHIAEALAERLQLGPMLDSLPEKIRSLTIIPDDSLLGFPYAALAYRGGYLIERFRLSFDFGFARVRAPASSARRTGALFVGVSEQLGEFCALPGVANEMQMLENWASLHKLPYTSVMNSSATKSAVLQKIQRASLAHIACHGVFAPNQPDASGFVLPSDDGATVLSLRDLLSLDLRAIQHVSLSSCWSADNFILPGRWIISLPNTLRQAGAQSVLASLWEIDDRFAVSFMSRFYEHLVHHPRDEALRLTQLNCIHRTNTIVGAFGNTAVDTSDPFYWASYVLYGDHQKLVI
jgi:CHAT domain-containing protein